MSVLAFVEPDDELSLQAVALARTLGGDVEAVSVGAPASVGVDVLHLAEIEGSYAPAAWAAAVLEAADGAEAIVGVVLAPHYSRLSIGGYREQLEAALAGRAELHFVESWHDDPGFVALLAERVRGAGAHVVFTAHSLPARILEQGDPYEDQLLETARLVAEAADLEDWSFSYQSESPTGEPWLQPDILAHLEELRARGVRDVLVCPVGFVSDHLEIRWDIDVEARERARELGMALRRIEMPNAEPAFVAVLAQLVERAPAGVVR